MSGSDLPTRPWSSLEIDVCMRQLVAKLDDAVAYYLTLGEKSADATHRAKLAEARAFMEAKSDPDLKSEAIRKAWVYERVHEVQHEADLADAAMGAQRLLITSMHHQADLLRSLARGNRDMMESPGWGAQGGSQPR